MTFSAEQIAGLVDGHVVSGSPAATVSGFAKIEEAKAGDLAFLSDPKYEHYLYGNAVSAVLVPKDFTPKEPVAAALIAVESPREAVARLLTLYQQMTARRTGISPQAVIASSATIGEQAYVGPLAVVGENVTIGAKATIHSGAVIGDGVTIGDDVLIYPNVTIYPGCRIGNRVILHAGCVIGADGFGFAPTANGYEKIPQVGIVVLEDDVEVGANACIDRAVMGATILHRGVKIDNLVQIAHNVEVGSHTVMSAQVGVAGSAKIGQWCMLGGQVGVAGHIVVGDKTYAGAQAGITGGVLPARGNVTVQGSPAIEQRLFARSSIALKQLPETLKEIAQLKKEIAQLKQQLTD